MIDYIANFSGSTHKKEFNNKLQKIDHIENLLTYNQI